MRFRAGKDLRSIKNILVNPAYQIKLTILTLWAGGCVVAFNMWAFYRFVTLHAMRIDPAILNDPGNSETYHELMSSIMQTVGLSMVIVLAFSIVCLIITHRSAGAVYHIHRVIREIRSGLNDSRVHLRKHDDFQDVAQSFNEMLDELTSSKSDKPKAD